MIRSGSEQLYADSLESQERIAFNTLNRKTGNRVEREFVDSETGDPVERDNQVKGYEMRTASTLSLNRTRSQLLFLTAIRR
jgi:non-homologous end joining protein Ku